MPAIAPQTKFVGSRKAAKTKPAKKAAPKAKPKAKRKTKK